MNRRISILFLSACGAAAAPSPASHPGQTCGVVAGTAQDYSPPQVPNGIVLLEPETCDGESFVGLDRRTGAPLTLEDAPCPAGGCETVHAHALLTEAFERLRARGIEGHEIGRGACGRTDGSFEDWNMSISVRDWRLARDALEIVAELMQERNAGGRIGVTVRGEACGVLLEAPW